MRGVVEIPRHSTVFRSIAWVVIFTQLFTGSAFADIKVFSKDTLAPQYLSQSNPPDKNAAQETKSIIGITSVLDYIGRRHFIDRRPIETIQRDARDQFRSTPSWLNAIEFKSLKMDGDALTILYKDPEDEKSHQARIFPRDHGASEAFGISFKTETTGTDYVDRNLKAGKDVPDGDDVIPDLIKDGNVIEISYDRDSRRLEAWTVGFIKDYKAGETNPSNYRIPYCVTDKPQSIPLGQLFDPDQTAKIIEWLAKQKVEKGDVRFRAVLGQPLLYWRDDIYNSNISHAGHRDAVIYLGLELLKYIFTKKGENLVINLLENDEIKHLKDQLYEHGDVKNEELRQRIEEFKDLIVDRRMRIPGVSHRSVRGIKNIHYMPDDEHSYYGGLPMVDGKRAKEGSVDFEILELDPADVDIQLSVSDDIGFLPNRFNNWAGIVRAGMSARVIVPHNRFVTKPLRGVTLREVEVPSDELGDSFAEMRPAVYTPVIRDHIENAGFDVDNLPNDPNFIGYAGNGNLLMNQRIVAYKNDKFYSLENEPSDKPYPCLVKFKKNSKFKTGIRRLRFERDAEGKVLKIEDVVTGDDLTGLVDFASSGIGIIYNYEDSPLVRFMKNETMKEGEDPEVWHDYDIRHYCLLPQFTSSVTGKISVLGMTQFYPPNRPSDPDLINNAVRGNAVTFPYEEGELHDLVTVLKNMGYDIAERKDAVNRFEYYLDTARHTITLRIERTLYPHNICVQTESGKIRFVIAKGLSGRKGVSFAEIPELLNKIFKDPKDKVKWAVVFDNGGDAMLNFRGFEVAPSFIQPPRSQIMSMFLFSRTERLPSRRSKTEKDEIRQAQDRVKFFRAFHRYLVNKKSGGMKEPYNQVERFIIENGQFIARQMESALDNISKAIGDAAVAVAKKEGLSPDKNKMAFNRRVDEENAKGWASVRALMTDIKYELTEDDFKGVERDGLAYYGILKDRSVLKFLEAVIAAKKSLTKVEAESVLPEIWRIKGFTFFLKYFSAAKDVQYTDIGRMDVDTKTKKLDEQGKAGILFDVALSFRRVEQDIRYGVFAKKIAETLKIDTSGNSTAPSKLRPLGINSSSSLMRSALKYIDSGNIRGTSLRREISIGREHKSESLRNMVEAAGRITGVLKNKPWQPKENSPGNYTNGWVDMADFEKLIFSSDKVVAYLTEEGAINLFVRGNDLERVESGKDISQITITLDRSYTVSQIFFPKQNMPLSRTTLAIQLNDSGILDKYPELGHILNDHLVWEEVSAEAREKDLIDNDRIDTELIDRAYKYPSGDISRPDILRLIDMKYLKTKVFRQRVLGALMHLYDEGHSFFIMADTSSEGKETPRIDEEMMRLIILDFLLQDIDEDQRVIERGVKKDGRFLLLANICREILDVKGPVDPEKDIKGVTSQYILHGSDKGKYMLTLNLSDSASKELREKCNIADEKNSANVRPRPVWVTLTRSDPSGQASGREVPGVSRESLEGAVNRQADLVSSGVPGLLPMLTSAYWERDYRPKRLGEGNSKEVFTNDIQVQVSKAVPDGLTLSAILEAKRVNPDTKMQEPLYSGAEKREAVRACVEAVIADYIESRERSQSHIGSYIKSPRLTDFILVRNDREGAWKVFIDEYVRHEECPSFAALKESFKGFPVPPELTDAINAAFKATSYRDLNMHLRNIIEAGDMAEIEVENGLLNVRGLSYTPPEAGSPERIGLTDTIRTRDMFSWEEERALLEWMKSHPARDGHSVKIRIAIDEKEFDLGWPAIGEDKKLPQEHSEIAVNSRADNCIYISLGLLKSAFGNSNRKFRERMIDNDLYAHIYEATPHSPFDSDEYGVIQRGVAKLKKEKTSIGAERDRRIDEKAVEAAINAVLDKSSFVFDIDNTLNLGRGQPIDPKMAEILRTLISKEKKIRFITGRSYTELVTPNKKFGGQRTLDPLLKEMVKRNQDFDIEVYTSDGAEMYKVEKDGSFTRNDDYNRPFTAAEMHIITDVLERSHAAIDREQQLTPRKIDKYITNDLNVKFSYSPYGKNDSGEYMFEVDKEAARAIREHFGYDRKTREVLKEELVSEMKRRGVSDIKGIPSGETTIGFVREDVSKEKAMRHILKNEGSAAYFGDEMSVTMDTNNRRKVGNDEIIANMAKTTNGLTVVSMDEWVSGVRPDIAEGVIVAGGLSSGSLSVLSGVVERLKKADDADNKIKSVIKAALADYSIEGDDALKVEDFSKGKGIHDPYYMIVSGTGTKYVLRCVNERIFPDVLEATRYEVWIVNYLKNKNIPVVPIVRKDRPLHNKEEWEKKDEDEYIMRIDDGAGHNKYYLLYEYREGVECTWATMTSGQIVNTSRMLARVQKELREADCPYKRKYSKGFITDMLGFGSELENLKTRITDKIAKDKRYAPTRGERFVLNHAGFIKDQTEKVKDTLGPVYNRLPKGPIHGDFSANNMIFDEDNNITGIFDWEFMREEALIFSLAPLIRAGDQHGRFNIREMKKIVEEYIKVFNTGNTLHPFTETELRAIPEIFRAKILERLSRLVDVGMYYESQKFRFAPEHATELRTMAMMDKDDELYDWHVNLINALWSLDFMISRGTFELEIVEPILSSDPSIVRDVVHDDLPAPRKAAEIIKEELIALRVLEKNNPHSPINIKPLGSFILKELLIDGVPVIDLINKNSGAVLWLKNGHRYTNGWCELAANDRVLKALDKVVVYRSSNKNVYIAIRGDDDQRVREGMDKALIEIILNDDGSVKSIMREDTFGSYDLSRSAIGLQLTASNIFAIYPGLEEALKYQLVWQDTNTDLQYREHHEASSIDMELVIRAIADQSKMEEKDGVKKGVADIEIRELEEYSYLKTKVARDKALAALGRLYEAGRIPPYRFARIVSGFLKNDIDEGYRVIERGIKNEREFVDNIFHNLFGSQNGNANNIDSVQLRYIGHDAEKDIFEAEFRMRAEDITRKVILTLVRHESSSLASIASANSGFFPLTMDAKRIRESAISWADASKKAPDLIAAFGGEFTEWDYRAKTLIMTAADKEESLKKASGNDSSKKKSVNKLASKKEENREKLTLENNIQVIAREYTEGKRLDLVLRDNAKTRKEKSAAIEACRRCVSELFNRTGYGIENPTTNEFVVIKEGDGYKAKIIGGERLVKFPNLELVLRVIDNQLLRYISGPATVSVSIEGSKIGAGIVNDEGITFASVDDIKWRDICDSKDASEQVLAINALIAKQVAACIKNSGIDVNDISSVGVVISAPVDEKNNLVGAPFPTPNLPYDHYNLKGMLTEMLAKQLGKSVEVIIYNDAKAALKSEMDQLGLLAGKKAGGILLIGMGVNLAVAKNGESYFGRDNEIKELGHNLVAKEDKDGLWRYRTTVSETKGDHPKLADGEMDFEDRNSAPNIDKRLMKASKNRFGLLTVTGLGINGDKEAIQSIRGIGEEIGRGIAAFFSTYRNEPFVYDLVLVSNVLEQFGKGVTDELGKDLFIAAIRKGAKEELLLLGVDEDKAERMASGIVRSQINHEHEFAAFIKNNKKEAAYQHPEPLIGHGFTAENLTGVEITTWTVSEQFKRTVVDLEGVIRNRSPSSLQKRLLDGLEEFKNGTDGRKMGIIDSHYDDTQHYYLGYGIKSAIGLGKEFLDPEDPLNTYLQEALLHELYQAVMSSGVAGEDIEGESTIHYTALRLQAMLLWNLNDVEQAAIQWMTPSELENHPKNLMKRAIIEWKNRHSPIPERMWKDDWKQLLSELREALNRPERSYKRLADFLVVCNDASISGFRHKYPVESRYPLLRAVTLLDDKERDLLVSVLKSNSKIKRLAISDTILLMLGKGDFDNWLEEQAPELVGRNIYQASSEIWYPGGGLGRVMQYHGEAEYKLLGPYSSQLRQIEPGYHWRRNATGDWTPMDYRSTEVMANPIVTELEEVERFPVAIGDRVTEAIVKRGKNDLGITVYLISDKDGFFTHSLYNYNDDGTNPQLPTWEQFTEFMCRASLELYRRQEEKEMAIKGDAWKAPIFHGNDAQFSLVWIYAMSATYQENGVTKRYADNPVINATIKAFTTHTYFNREARSGKDGQARLRTLHVPEQYWEKYFKSNRGSNWEEVYDLTSAGLRTADWTGAVARKHMNDVRIYDEWMGLDLRAVTNGDSRARTSSVFRSILSDKSIFPDETVDLEHPTPAQILKAKREAKRRVALKPGQFYTSKPEQNGSILNPDQYVIIYTGRLAREKVDRKRALSDESIEAMVKDGKQVVIYANVQNYQESRDLAEGLKNLAERLSRKNYSGKLVFVPRFGLFDQRALFAAANIGVVGSDPHTEAAGFSETDFASCGALVVAPPWPDGEGILVAQGIKLNFDIEGEGNTLIPEVEVLEQDIAQGLVNNDTSLRARIRDAYIAIIKRALDMPEEKFAKYMETSYRLSRVLEALPTGAEYLRQFNQTVANKNAVTTQAALKGSIKNCLYDIFYSDLKSKTDISTGKDLVSKRKKTIDTTYALRTVQEEVKILKALGILVEGTSPNTSRLRSQIRNLSPPEIETILSIPELDRATIPTKDIAALRDRIEKLITGSKIKIDGPITISISLGGTEVGAGVVNDEGEVKAMAKNIQWREVYGNDATADNISEAILRQVASFVDNGDVNAGNINGVGIAFAGPIDEDAGIVGTPFKAPNLPFDHYPLKAKLETLLKTRFGRDITVTMYNDSKAALLGEMSPKGLLAGKPSGGIMILGTGVNITVARDAQAYFGAKNEIRELGHNLVAKADADGVWHYRYTGLETLGDHPGFAPGEMDFEDRNGGPNLDKRFNEASGGKFGIKEITQAAKNRDVLAIELIRQAGEEIGRGIAAFQYAYRSEPFIYNLVLVSSVSENLGKGVMNEDGNDLFMSAVQSAASKELVDMGMAAAEAEKAGRGIVRSAMTYERELVAFTPKTADTPSAGILSDMTVIHNMNMDLLPPVDNGKVLYHVIAEELIPVTMTGHMYKLARETENMKMRERIKIVKRKDLESETARLKSSSGNIVLAAVQYKEDLLLLPKDVKALVFTSADGGAFGFKQLEGVIAALRALYRDDAGSLARLYKILTGSPFAGKEMDIAKYLSDPRALAEIIMFNLEPSVAKDPEELKHLNEKLLEFLYKA